MSDLQHKSEQVKVTMDKMKENSFEIKETEHPVKIYTGLQNYGVFHFLVSKIKPIVQKLQYFKGTE